MHDTFNRSHSIAPNIPEISIIFITSKLAYFKVGLAPVIQYFPLQLTDHILPWLDQGCNISFTCHVISSESASSKFSHGFLFFFILILKSLTLVAILTLKHTHIDLYSSCLQFFSMTCSMSNL